MTTRLLLDEKPLIVLPSLACTLGLNGAIIIQQLHYWLQVTKHRHDGRPWIYKSFPEWHDEFPWWSEKTIKRTMTTLEKDGIVLIGNYNKAGFDNTKWYSLNYEKLRGICPDDQDNLSRREGHDGGHDEDKVTQGQGHNDPLHRDKMTRPIPEIISENKTESTTEIKPPTTTAREHEDEDAKSLWDACKRELEIKMQAGPFGQWIDPMTAIRFENGALVLEHIGDFARNWVVDRYSGLIKSTLTAMIGQEITVKVLIREGESEREDAKG